MKVQTKAYGLIDVDEGQKITFPVGIFGFEQFNNYVLIDAEQQPFYWLQSVDSPAVAFVLINPFLFRPDYEINTDDAELAAMGITAPEQALVFSIVTIPDDGPMSANLLGPLVINKHSRVGRQIVLSDPRWKTKHDIMSELASDTVAGAEETERQSC